MTKCCEFRALKKGCHTHNPPWVFLKVGMYGTKNNEREAPRSMILPQKSRSHKAYKCLDIQRDRNFTAYILSDHYITFSLVTDTGNHSVGLSGQTISQATTVYV